MFRSYTIRSLGARRCAAVHLCVVFSILFQGCSLRGQSIMNVLSFGAVPDGVMRTDGSMVVGSPVLTSASGSFASADAGKYIQVIGAGPGGTSHSDGAMFFGSAVLTSGSGTFSSSDVGRGIVVTGAGSGGGHLVTTIQSYSSPTSVTLSASAQTQVSGRPYFYGYMTLEGTIQSVQSSTSVTLSASAFSTISSAVFAYGTENHASFQAAVDAAGQAGGGTVNVPAPPTCPSSAVCGYVLKATDQMTAQAPGAVKIRYNNISLIGDAPQTNLFCRGAYGTYSGEVAFNGAMGNIRGFCLTIGDNGGPNGVAGEAVSNVTIARLHLYGMTNGNTFNVNFGYPPQVSDGWDITHKGIYMWDNSPSFSNITIDSVIIQDFKAENIYAGGTPISGMVIKNSTLTNFNGNGISMLASDLQVLNNTISNGSNAAVENSTVSMGSGALVRQIYQGNTISQFPREGIVVVGVDGGVASGSVQIVNNYFDTIAQTNPSGTESAIYIASQNNFVPPANITVTGNTCHDCQSFGVFETSGNTLIQGNAFIVDHYNAGNVFGFMYQLNGVTIANNTGTTTGNGHSVGAVYVMNPGYASGSFPWNNVVLKGNTWTFPGAPQYQFVTSSGLGWNLVTAHNLNWQGDSCTGCTHSDVNHGMVDLSRTNLIEPFGPVVYLFGNASAVTASVDASKEQDGAQIQIVNTGSKPVSFGPDGNLSLSSAITLPGGSNSSVTFVYSAALGKYTSAQSGNSAVINATGGTPQSATVSTSFSTPLQATLTDANNNPLSGVTVTFTAPGSGASATFSGSSTATAVTNTSGIAAAPAPTANGLAGTYNVTATAPGVTTPASFSLTNAGVRTGSGSLSGSSNSATTTFNLTAEGSTDWIHWGDAALNRKSGVTPQISNYTVVGSGTPTSYTNDPRGLTWTDGTPTGAGPSNNGLYINFLQNGFSFTVPADTNTRTLTVHVGGWMSGALLTAHLSDGSAGDFVDSIALLNAQYDRNYTLTYAAASAGQTLTISWVVTAGSGNVTLNGAALSSSGAAAPNIAATSGTPQSATINATFSTALQALVTNASNSPLSGVTVTFTAPATGASASFSGSTTANAVTNASGIATAPALIANAQTGGYTVTASAPGVATTANFSLTNLPGAPSSITASSGTPQSATVNSAFGTALQVVVKDSGNNPLGSVTVTFTAPGTGASAGFSGSLTGVAVTNASGIATAPTLTANGATGSYTLTASAGVATPASFNLTNVAAAPSSIAAVAGTPQSTNVNTAFGAALQAVVRDAGNNPLSGVTVTFTTPASGASARFGGSASATAVTNSSGIATSPALTANGQSGSYAVTASVTGVAAAANFSLTNTAVTASGGTLTGSGNSATTAFNLTAEGTADWVHWGDATLTRKAGVGAQISNYTVVGTGPVTSYTNDPRGLSWSDGAPAPSGSNNNGIYVNFTGNGFSFTAPADTNTRVLTVHVGGWLSGGTFTAHLSDGSAPDYVDSTSLASGQFDRNYTLTYDAASAGQTLTISWVTNAGSGNVTLNGAALSGSGPSIVASGGSPQSTNVNSAFAAPLQATVMSAGNTPMSGVTVTFTTAQVTGPSATFNGSITATAVTNSNGVAASPAVTANGRTGSYTVTASVTGIPTAAGFSLTNVSATASSIAASAGTPQSATVSSPFGGALQATVKDASNNPLSGVTVTFTAPTAGASASFGGSSTATAITNASGIATAPALTANSQSGAYTVTANATGAGSASFSLTNTAASAGGSIKLVQSNTLDSLINLQSAVLAFKSNNTAGNWIGVVIAGTPTNTDTFAVTDSNGNTYRPALTLGGAAMNSTLAIYYAENIKAGPNTVRIVPNIGVYLRVSIVEYSGIATANSLDVTAGTVGNSAVANSGNATTTANGDLLLGALMTLNGHSLTGSGGYTFEQFVPGAPSTKLSTEDQVQTTSGVASANATLGFADNWMMGLAAFKAGH
jgi:hypothetical protein